MKPLPATVSAAILLLASATANAGDGYFNAVGRNIGYGVSDGYHAHRNCPYADTTCDTCAPVQQPVFQQPVFQQPVFQQPVFQQPIMPQPIMPQPIMAPASAHWLPYQFQPVGYPVGYAITPMHQPWYQSHAPGYGQPVYVQWNGFANVPLK